MSLQVSGTYMLCQYFFGWFIFIPMAISTVVSFFSWYNPTFCVNSFVEAKRKHGFAAAACTCPRQISGGGWNEVYLIALANVVS